MRQDSASDMASAASLPGGGNWARAVPDYPGQETKEVALMSKNATLSLQPRAVYDDMIDDLYYFDIVARRRDPERKLARIYEVGERPDWLEGEIDEEPMYDYKTGLYTERGLDRPDDPLRRRPQKGDSTFESWMSLKRQRKELEIKRAEQRAQKAKEDAISRGFYDSDNPDAEYDEFGYEYLGVPAKFVDQEELDEQYTKAFKLPETPADYPAFREQEKAWKEERMKAKEQEEEEERKKAKEQEEEEKRKKKQKNASNNAQKRARKKAKKAAKREAEKEAQEAEKEVQEANKEVQEVTRTPHKLPELQNVMSSPDSSGIDFDTTTEVDVGDVVIVSPGDSPTQTKDKVTGRNDPKSPLH
ncbi:hypothetical protein D6C91_03071 [Aureobasidium pullulans]|uniref:Uncharacterized protein n=1 Tax=Aureobasidium pullulans TaxID=5580 RepID=A0A4S9TKC2_AURPU|nr:hypothetical protein D6C91_03071 [Aureobasidium pullulans]